MRSVAVCAWAASQEGAMKIRIGLAGLAVLLGFAPVPLYAPEPVLARLISLEDDGARGFGFVNALNGFSGLVFVGISARRHHDADAWAGIPSEAR